MMFEVTCWNGRGEKIVCNETDWERSGSRWRHSRFGLSFECVERADSLAVPADSIREEGEYRLHSVIVRPGWNALPEHGGKLLLPLNLGCFCNCAGKPSADVRIPLFNLCPSEGNFSLLASIDNAGRVRMTIAEEGREEAFIRLRTAWGKPELYSADFEFVLREYEDIPIQTGVSLYFREFTGGLPEIADQYRNHIFAHRDVRLLEEKMRDNPELQYSAKSLVVRMRLAVKEVGALAEQTPDLQPGMFVFMTFPMAGKVIAEFRRQGISNIDFNLVGWNYGGHDGAYPQVFPVEERLGGEEALRKLLQDTQAAGYAISIHDNYFDMYPVAENFKPENALRTHDNLPVKGGIWGGGQATQICPECAWNEYYPANRARISTLPLNGAYYVDVFGCSQLTPCYAAAHPVTRAQNAVYWKKIFADLQAHYHVTMSEGVREWALPEVDRGYSVCSAPGVTPVTSGSGEKLDLIDQEAGLYPLIYHDCVLYNTYRSAVNAFPESREYLLNLAMGGIPLYYYYQRFAGKIWDDKLHYTTPERIRREVSLIGRAAEDMKRLEGLTTRRIINIESSSKERMTTAFDNGVRIEFNLGDHSAALKNGMEIPPHDFIVTGR